MRTDAPAGPVTKGLISALLCTAFLLVAGCTTVPPAQVAAFAKGVDSVKVQLDTTFANINQLAAEDEIDRAATLPTLTEENVGVLLKSEDIAKWDVAFASIGRYADSLSLLLAPERANDFSTAAQGLGTALSKLDRDALPSAGVAAGFVELGRLLIEAKAETDALNAARKADPGVQEIFSQLASVIGESNQDPGTLRATVRSHWLLRMGEEQAAFSEAAPGARRATVVDFVDLRDKRDAQDLQLGALRQSLLDLGAAHAALARGSAIDLDTAIGRIQQEIDVTQALNEHFKSLKKPKTEDQ